MGKYSDEIMTDMRGTWRRDLDRELAAYRLAREVRAKNSDPDSAEWNMAWHASIDLKRVLAYRLDNLGGLMGEW